MPGAMMPRSGRDGTADGSDQIYISIPEDNWDEFARDLSVQVYNNKADYKRKILSALLALLGGVATYFISGHALRPIRELAQNWPIRALKKTKFEPAYFV